MGLPVSVGKQDRIQSSVPGSAGDEPYGWGAFTVATPFDHRDEVLKTFAAREVIVGLPEHAGLALAIAVTWEHVYYATRPVVADQLQSAVHPVERA